MVVETSSLVIIIYMYISAVRHSVYTCLQFQRYAAIFLPLRACAHDVGDTGANTSTCGPTEEGKLTSRD